MPSGDLEKDSNLQPDSKKQKKPERKSNEEIRRDFELLLSEKYKNAQIKYKGKKEVALGNRWKENEGFVFEVTNENGQTFYVIGAVDFEQEVAVIAAIIEKDGKIHLDDNYMEKVNERVRAEGKELDDILTKSDDEKQYLSKEELEELERDSRKDKKEEQESEKDDREDKTGNKKDIEDALNKDKDSGKLKVKREINIKATGAYSKVIGKNLDQYDRVELVEDNYGNIYTMGLKDGKWQEVTGIEYTKINKKMLTLLGGYDNPGNNPDIDINDLKAVNTGTTSQKGSEYCDGILVTKKGVPEQYGLVQFDGNNKVNVKDVRIKDTNKDGKLDLHIVQDIDADEYVDHYPSEILVNGKTVDTKEIRKDGTSAEKADREKNRSRGNHSRGGGRERTLHDSAMDRYEEDEEDDAG